MLFKVTNISLDFEIEPNGKINILTCGDQIHSGPFACWGWSLPQDMFRSIQINSVMNIGDFGTPIPNRKLFTKMSLVFVDKMRKTVRIMFFEGQ